MLNVWVNDVTWNKPPYRPIPLSNDNTNKLDIAKKLVIINVFITTLEYNILLSRLKVTAFDINK